MHNRMIALAALTLIGCGKGKSDDSTTTPTGAATATGTGTGTGSTGVCDPTQHTIPAMTGDPLTVALGPECPLDNQWGSFVVSVFDIFSIVDGSVTDGVVPITVLEPVGTDGTCTLLKRGNPFCDPACQPDETCDFDGTCLPFPQNQDVGVVTVGGLAKDVIMCPILPGNNYFDTQLPHPAFGPGDLIELQTTGGAYDPIVLHGVGVEPITLSNPNWVVQPGVDLPIAWSLPTVPLNPGQHVQVRLNIDQHGNTPVQMFCEFPDTGSADLPSSLIDQLVAFGVTGFPNATVTRRTTDSTLLSSGGCVDLIISSPAEPNVLVDGYIPCNPGGTTTCPTGMTCNAVTGLCE